MTWSDTLLRIVKDDDIGLVTYVPDNVLTPLIAGVSADNYFLPVTLAAPHRACGALRSICARPLSKKFH